MQSASLQPASCKFTIFDLQILSTIFFQEQQNFRFLLSTRSSTTGCIGLQSRLGISSRSSSITLTTESPASPIGVCIRSFGWCGQQVRFRMIRQRITGICSSVYGPCDSSPELSALVHRPGVRPILIGQQETPVRQAYWSSRTVVANWQLGQVTVNDSLMSWCRMDEDNCPGRKPPQRLCADGNQHY